MAVAKQQSVQGRFELFAQSALEFAGMELQVGIVSVRNFVPAHQPFVPLTLGHKHVESFRECLDEFPVADLFRLLLPSVGAVKIEPGCDWIARRP